jgi:hypothetical protein
VRRPKSIRLKPHNLVSVCALRAQIPTKARLGTDRPASGRGQTGAARSALQGYLVHKKQHSTLGPPQGPRHNLWWCPRGALFLVSEVAL